MALKAITKASDTIEVSTTIVALYGQPGTGKTSIGGTSAHPLLLDFDRGSHRSAFRPDTVKVEAWADVAQIARDDLAGYSTLVVDTAGRALDFLAAAMPPTEGKTQLKRPSGGLTLQGFGRLKDDFVSWLRKVNTFGLDVILICHDKEEKDGDQRIVRPDITGGSYHEIVKVADFVGYVAKLDGRSTILDFNPTAQWIGKNSAGFPPLPVPDFATDPEWFAGIMARMKAALGGIAQRQKEAVDKLAEFRGQIEFAKTAGELDTWNALIEEAASLGKPLSLQAWTALKKAAEGQGLVYDRDAKAFRAKAEPGQKEGTPEAREAA
ncbi:AAA domain-containing protein [Methylomagnum ishizawai]|uniref:AAA domain-containing protein n=1 Tax=Methylomagnum ishizawai TaxID=1760988 RepID=A0A1Y6D6V6_9GAMM|nr:ATP-binding protein [Methylomagnum ishizawai]SMF96074.1 AAA domain-containing protein [Methylomagnum ishizawai]